MGRNFGALQARVVSVPGKYGEGSPAAGGETLVFRGSSAGGQGLGKLARFFLEAANGPEFKAADETFCPLVLDADETGSRASIPAFVHDDSIA